MLAPRETPEAAIDIAHRMRVLMSADLDEYDMADRVRAMNDEMAVDATLFSQAWHVLAAPERRAWKELVNLRRNDDY